MKITLTKLTIIAERLLKDPIIDLIRSEGATGYTMTAVDGEGSRGVRASDWEGRNVQIDTIVSPAIADAILDKIADEFFDDFSIVAWETDVRVLRRSKFAIDTPSQERTKGTNH